MTFILCPYYRIPLCVSCYSPNLVETSIKFQMADNFIQFWSYSKYSATLEPIYFWIIKSSRHSSVEPNLRLPFLLPSIHYLYLESVVGGRQFITGLTDKQQLALALTPTRKFPVHDWPNLHFFGLWEEVGVPRGNTRRHGECMQTPHRNASATRWVWIREVTTHHHAAQPLFSRKKIHFISPSFGLNVWNK